jgi:hypothetical protein
MGPLNSRIEGELSKKRAPDGSGATDPMKIGRLARRLRMEFALGKPLGAAGCGNLFSHLTTARASDPTVATRDAQEALWRGAV